MTSCRFRDDGSDPAVKPLDRREPPPPRGRRAIGGRQEPRSTEMKYMMLIYENAGTREAFFADEKLMAAMDTYVDGLRASGEFVEGEGLTNPSTARVVRVQNGVPAVTDGPFMESKEYFGGY